MVPKKTQVYLYFLFLLVGSVFVPPFISASIFFIEHKPSIIPPCYKCVPPYGLDVEQRDRVAVDYTMNTTCTKSCGMVITSQHIKASRSNPAFIRSPFDPNKLIWFSGLTYNYEYNIGDDDIMYHVLTLPDYRVIEGPSLVVTDQPRRDLTTMKFQDLALEKYERLHGEDLRVFRFRNSFFAIYNTRLTVTSRMWITKLQITLDNCGQHVVTALTRNNSVHMRFDGKEYRNDKKKEINEKNWSPFQYDDGTGTNTIDTNKGRKSSTQLYLIYEVVPHRIVAITGQRQTQTKQRTLPRMSAKEHAKHVMETLNFRMVTTAYLTNVSTPLEMPVLWEQKWGKIRGGTPALLLPDKSAYLTFFHSKAMVHAHKINTYFMGAYLFASTPPFAITHMSSEPIVAPPFYNAKYAGWSYRRCDFIVYPMSFEFIPGPGASARARSSPDTTGDNSTRASVNSNSNSNQHTHILLSYGRQDREGWMLELQLEQLLVSMQPVNSGPTIDKNK